ncbi:response regulator transcription factor [Pedobacter sp. SYSU D00535]|uniref:response regulator n=1 Tax=Pedobacter sp. SYSU D00535 TaxID=2810308 RepID=UPI001A96558F|nr:response regulator transcription factor [Pedobacter sp. SYSU D00535]
MTILIADDHAIVRHGITLVVKDILPQAMVYEADSFTAAVRALTANAVDLLILDINIPGGNNVEMIEHVKTVFPSTKVLMFSGYDELLYSERCIALGASGYLSKNASPSDIKNAIRTVLSGRTYISEEVKSSSVGGENGNLLSLLSNRELEVAMLLVQGLGVIEISKSLNLQTSTVSTYKNRVFEKLRISNLADLIEKFKLYKSL